MEKLYPSPFNVGDRFEFENKHGRTVLEAVSLPVPVGPIRAVDAPPECLITLEQVEQIALITDQIRLQPAVNWLDGATHCSWVKHSTLVRLDGSR